jgi:hypothetical protein
VLHIYCIYLILICINRRLDERTIDNVIALLWRNKWMKGILKDDAFYFQFVFLNPEQLLIVKYISDMNKNNGGQNRRSHIYHKILCVHKFRWHDMYCSWQTVCSAYTAFWHRINQTNHIPHISHICTYINS